MFGRGKREEWKAAISSLVRGLADAAVLVDANLGLLECNRAFLVMAGHRPRSLQAVLDSGKSVFDTVRDPKGDDRALAAQTLASGRQAHDPWVVLHNERGDTFDVMRTLMPIVDEAEKVVGLLAIYRDVSAEAKLHVDYKALLAQEAARADTLEQEVAERTAQLRNALEEVTRLSRVDPLTGVLNRRAFTEHAVQAVAMAQRHDRNCAFLMTDLDFFKSINDTYGHAAGDSLLKAVAAGLNELIRGSDKVARFGGEEFVVMLSETNPASVHAVCERIRNMVMSLPISEIVVGKTEPQTVSIGAAIFPLHGSSFEELTENADKALYVAKETGRNRSILFSDEIQAKEAEVPEPKAVGRAKAKVLVVDDDEQRLARYRQMIAAEFPVSTVTNVSNAMAICVRERFDVLVASEKVGTEDGLSFLQRSLAERPSAVRILLTSNVDGFMSIRAGNRGRIDHFLLEDEAESHLVAAIRDALARRELALNELLEHNDLADLTPPARAAGLEALIEKGALRMVYQPILDAKSRELRAYEALCRPMSNEFANPSELFDVAVEVGRVWALGNLVREKIADDLANAKLDLPVFVNLHPAELGNPELLQGSPFFDLQHANIVFEITERSAISKPELFRQFLGQLRERGFRFAVDDLGAGYASLNSVALIGPEYIKVDMTLIRDIDKSERKRDLVQSLVAFANKAQTAIVAEGVETDSEAEVAQAIGCHFLQGFLLGRPGPLSS